MLVEVETSELNGPLPFSPDTLPNLVSDTVMKKQN